MFAAGIALTSAVSAVSQSQINFAAHHVGGKVRIAICSLVCRKVSECYFSTRNIAFSF